MNNQEKGFWFTCGILLSTLIWCVGFGLNSYLQDVKPGDVVERWNPDTTRFDLGVVVSITKTNDAQHYNVYPIKLEHWNMKYPTPDIKKIDHKSVDYR